MMDRARLYNCVRVLVALQCLELVWSYSILIDTLKNDQQIENSLNTLIQSQERIRRQAEDPQQQQHNPDLTGGTDQGADVGNVDPSASPSDGGAQEGGFNPGTTADPQGSDPQPDSGADPSSNAGDGSNADQANQENVDPGYDHGNNPDQPQDGSSSDSAPSDSGQSDSGNSDSGQSDSGHSDGGSSDSGNSDSGQSDSGQSDAGNSDSGHSDSGQSDGGNSDSGHSDGGNSDPSGHSDSGHSDPSGSSDQHNPLDMTRPGEMAPMALPMTAADQSEAPVAMAMTGGHGNKEQPYHGNSDPGVNVGHVDTVPLEAHVEPPKAMPQRRAAPIENTEGQSFRQAPVAMAQRQARPAGQAKPAGQNNQRRPPPNWQKGNQRRPAPSGGGQAVAGAMVPGTIPMAGAMVPGAMPMVPGANPMMPGADQMNQMQKMAMMRAQSNMMKENMESQNEMYRKMYKYNNRFNPQFFPGATGNQTFPGPYGNMYPPYNFGDREGFEGYPGYGMDFRTGYPPCTNMSDPACQHQIMMANREIQVETPFGEMDMEPGEMDLEGAPAHHLLQQLGMGGLNMNPIHQEINLNQNVLRALKQRFGVNTTAGVRRLSTNPEFQAFMYRVLTHSRPLPSGEYNANLTQAEVNWILNDLSASSAAHRLKIGNLDHAQLNKENITSATGRQTSNTVLTINGGPNKNPFANMGMMGIPGFSAQTQVASAAQAINQPANQPGMVEALVQGMMGGGVGTQPGNGGLITGTQATGTALAAGTPSPSAATGVQPSPSSASGVQPSPSSATGAAINSGNNLGQPDIIGKDGKFGVSKDQRRRNEKLLAKQNKVLAEQNQAIAAAGPNMQGGQLGTQGSIPIGIQEAGLGPFGVTNSTIAPPMKATPSGYTSSTVFAIAAISLIAVTIIIGPIMCYLCKLSEKREEKKRKQKAIKNRDVSDNNIMESMVLHDFGKEAANVGASPYGERYTTLDSDLEEMQRYRKVGYLP